MALSVPLGRYLRRRPRADDAPRDWSALAARLGRPAMVFQREAVTLGRAEFDACPGDLGRRSFAEQAFERGLLPADWQTPTSARCFAYGTPGAPVQQDLMEADMGLLLDLASVGAATLGAVEALAREALARHWDPAVRVAPVRWESARVSPVRAESEVYAWLHQWDTGSAQAQALIRAHERDLGARASMMDLPPTPSPVAESAERRAVAQTIQAANGLIREPLVSLAVRDAWADEISGEERPLTLWGQDLWAVCFLDEAARTTRVPRRPARVGDDRGPTLAELRAFYDPWLALCALGIVPGAFTAEGARLLVTMGHPEPSPLCDESEL